MAFQRKHYEAIAAIINGERHSFSHEPAAIAALDMLQDKFSRMFAADNPRFDREKFDAACRARICSTQRRARTTMKKRNRYWQPNATQCRLLGIPSFVVWASQLAGRQAYPETTGDEWIGYPTGAIENPRVLHSGRAEAHGL